MEAFMYRHHPQWQRARQLVVEGKIGELRTIQTFFSYFLLDATNIRHMADIGGGGLMDIGCYCISLSRFIFGEEPGTGMPTGLEALTIWPIGCILMHLAVAGILYCFAHYAIFGRPKELPPDAASDFRKHVDALGELLQQSRDMGYASERLSHYQQTIRDKPT